MNAPLVVALDAQEGDAGFRQRVAGVELWSAQPLVAGAEPARRPAEPRAEPRSWTPLATFAAAAADEPTAAWRAETGELAVEYGDGERFVIAIGGASIERRPAAPNADARVSTRLFGAPLALALARRGVHLLHAAAIERDGIVVALAADSGGGKSTLASAAAAAGWRRVADDILPVRLDQRPLAYSGYPQLKLAATPLAASEPSRALPLRAVVTLARGEAVGAPRLARVSLGGAALALAAATVATRLFDESLLAAHFDVCAAAAQSLAVGEFRYPNGIARLDEALEALARALG